MADGLVRPQRRAIDGFKSHPSPRILSECTLDEPVASIADAIGSELEDDDRPGTDARPYIHSFRRNVQRMHLDMLMNLVLSEPGELVPADANAVARHVAAELSENIGEVLERRGLDAASRIHLADVKKRIDKALEANYLIGADGGSMGGLIFFREADDSTQKPVYVLPK